MVCSRHEKEGETRATKLGMVRVEKRKTRRSWRMEKGIMVRIKDEYVGRETWWRKQWMYLENKGEVTGEVICL